ncbi:MAG: PIN domain-containing protein [Deltaproteobacteria bacterium]|nr:PIN domain-containing protein [Deltaproteobacteria bacterium]
MAIVLYFDTNVLCRPFDDQMVRRIRRETEAFERILEKIEAKEAAFISSEILVFEVQRIILAAKRAKVSIYLGLHQGYQSTTSETLAVANEIIRNFKLAPRDALHAASAALGKAQYFLSCDDGITRRFKTRPLSVNIGTEHRILEVMNPAVFVANMEW